MARCQDWYRHKLSPPPFGSNCSTIRFPKKADAENDQSEHQDPTEVYGGLLPDPHRHPDCLCLGSDSGCAKTNEDLWPFVQHAFCRYNSGELLTFSYLVMAISRHPFLILYWA